MSSSTIDAFFYDPKRSLHNEDIGFSPEEKAFFCDTMSSRVPPGGRLFVYMNKEVSRPPADQHFAAFSAKGYAVEFPASTKMARFVSGDQKLLFGSRWFGHTAVLKIPPGSMREKDMVEVMTSRGLSLVLNEADRSARAELAEGLMSPSPKDSVSWRAGISSHGHLVGIYKEEKRVIGSEGSADEYYAVVHCDSGVVGEVLSAFAVANPNMSLYEFASSPQYAAAMDFSRRNVARILASVADMLGLDRSAVRRSDDASARVSAQRHEAPPEIVSDLYVDTVYNRLKVSSSERSGGSVAYYGGTSCLDDFAENGGRTALLVNARGGLTILHLNRAFNYREASQSVVTVAGDDDPSSDATTTMVPYKVGHKNPMAAFPIGTGKHRANSDREALAMSRIRYEEADRLYGIYHWPRKPKLDCSFADESRGDPSARVVKGLNRRLYSYRDLDPNMRSLLRLMVGQQTRMTDLSPVVVIIP